MKNINIKLLSLALGLIALSSCTDDDLSGMDPLPKPMATTTVTSLSLAEGESTTILFTIDRPISKVSQFKIELVGGGADETDISAGDQGTDADTGIPGQGFEMTVPAYATSFEIPVSVIRDLDQSEGNETVTLKISAAGVRTILTPQPYLIPLTIIDFQYCLWTLETSDTYGDGWQGAHIDLVVDGETFRYAEEEEMTTFDVPVAVGGVYSFTYVSGGGTGGSPGYENENYYKLTSPDGTIFEDGTMDYSGIPTPGLITSGTSNCN
jgi:hypothetical protein